MSPPYPKWINQPKSIRKTENKSFSLPPKPQTLQIWHKQWKYCYYQSSNIKIPPQNQYSTKQGGRLPAPGSRTSLLPNRKAQLPFSISGTRQTPGQELLTSTRSLLWAAFIRCQTQSHTGPWGQNHFAHPIRAMLVPHESYRQHLQLQHRLSWQPHTNHKSFFCAYVTSIPEPANAFRTTFGY